MCFVWDNYIQIYDKAEHMFLMGVGNASLAIKMLLLNRGNLDVFQSSYVTPKPLPASRSSPRALH